jgi:hypothetical protein
VGTLQPELLGGVEVRVAQVGVSLALGLSELSGDVCQLAGYVLVVVRVVAGVIGYRALQLSADQDLDHPSRYALPRRLPQAQACRAKVGRSL